MKHAKEKAEGEQSGRGRGRGKGRGRGRGGKGRGKARVDDSSQVAGQSGKSSKRKQDKEDTNQDCAKKTRRSKVQTQQDKDWNAEWDGHWCEEWGEDWEQGWNQPEKDWDRYAWWDGKDSLSKIAEQKEGNGATQEPANETTTKAAPKSRTKSEAAPKGSAKSQAAPKRSAKSKAVPKPKAKSEAAPKGSPKAKAVRANKATSSKPKGNQPDKAKSTKTNGESKVETPKKRKPSQVFNITTPRPDMVAEAAAMLVTFGETLVDVEQDNMRTAIRSQLSGSESCSLNIYWSRNAVGLKCSTVKKDIAYFRAATHAGPLTARMGIACKAADLLVARTHVKYFSKSSVHDFFGDDLHISMYI